MSVSCKHLHYNYPHGHTLFGNSTKTSKQGYCWPYSSCNNNDDAHIHFEFCSAVLLQVSGQLNSLHTFRLGHSHWENPTSLTLSKLALRLQNVLRSRKHWKL